ncbi:MAG: hypothetical protein ACK559_17670, partial [bacterium]
RGCAAAGVAHAHVAALGRAHVLRLRAVADEHRLVPAPAAGGHEVGEVGGFQPRQLRRQHARDVHDVVGIDEEHRLLSDILGAGGPAVCLPSRGRV